MVKVIVVAHGNFSTGILSSLELIAGKQEDVVGIDFVSGMSSNQVKAAVCTELVDAQDVLILTDLLGGTPFNVSSTLSVEYADKNIRVLSGLNLAMLLEAVFSRVIAADLGQLVEKVLDSCHKGIADFASLASDDDEDDFEGGI
ncbi:hypothetical protein [Streptococcus sp. 20-1249]|uniref:PTS sugar transporter subunit IIA domain-containing protein n=1 Tax=Streptococcus hepaticus TaxID=3349163 RepID=UPI0037479C62